MKGKPTYTPDNYLDIEDVFGASRLAYLLVDASIFFTMEPLPDDVYRFYVKEEAYSTVERIINRENVNVAYDERIQIGDLVCSKSPGGLVLAKTPCTGIYNNQREEAGVFKTGGEVIDTQDIVIDYDSWPDSKDDGLGKVPYRNCLVKHSGGQGWAGEGALVNEKRKRSR